VGPGVASDRPGRWRRDRPNESEADAEAAGQL